MESMRENTADVVKRGAEPLDDSSLVIQIDQHNEKHHVQEYSHGDEN